MVSFTKKEIPGGENHNIVGSIMSSGTFPRTETLRMTSQNSPFDSG